MEYMRIMVNWFLFFMECRNKLSEKCVGTWSIMWPSFSNITNVNQFFIMFTFICFMTNTLWDMVILSQYCCIYSQRVNVQFEFSSFKRFVKFYKSVMFTQVLINRFIFYFYWSNIKYVNIIVYLNGCECTDRLYDTLYLENPHLMRHQ